MKVYVIFNTHLLYLRENLVLEIWAKMLSASQVHDFKIDYISRKKL